MPVVIIVTEEAQLKSLAYGLAQLVTVALPRIRREEPATDEREESQ